MTIRAPSKYNPEKADCAKACYSIATSRTWFEYEIHYRFLHVEGLSLDAGL